MLLGLPMVKPPVPMMGLLSVVVLPLLLRTIASAEPNEVPPAIVLVAPVEALTRRPLAKVSVKPPSPTDTAVSSKALMVLPVAVNASVEPSLTVSPGPAALIDGA